MGRKSRERMMAGRSVTAPGEGVYMRTGVTPGNGGSLSPRNRRRLFEKLAAATGPEREAVRENLRQAGSDPAAALLADLEERWDEGQAEQRGETT